MVYCGTKFGNKRDAAVITFFACRNVQSSDQSSPTACRHAWSAWTTEARPLYVGASDDVIFVLVRKCFACGAIDYGNREEPFSV